MLRSHSLGCLDMEVHTRVCIWEGESSCFIHQCSFPYVHLTNFAWLGVLWCLRRRNSPRKYSPCNSIKKLWLTIVLPPERTGRLFIIYIHLATPFRFLLLVKVWVLKQWIWHLFCKGRRWNEGSFGRGNEVISSWKLHKGTYVILIFILFISF